METSAFISSKLLFLKIYQRLPLIESVLLLEETNGKLALFMFLSGSSCNSTKFNKYDFSLSTGGNLQ